MSTRRKRGEIVNTILRVINSTGGSIASNTIPYAVKAVNIFDKREKRKYEYYVRNKLIELKKSGFISVNESNGNRFYKLSRKGNELLNKYKDTKIKKRKHWDGKWRIVSFDIPEKFRTTRNKLRKELINQGFYNLQDSVWVIPYDCEEFIALLKTDLKIGKNLLYIEAGYLDFDKDPKEFFNL